MANAAAIEVLEGATLSTTPTHIILEGKSGLFGGLIKHIFLSAWVSLHWTESTVGGGSMQMPASNVNVTSDTGTYQIFGKNCGKRIFNNFFTLFNII